MICALDFYLVDLSAVVSRHIGETEKNLGRPFDPADCGGAILYFDEPDANLEIEYFLQRLESYGGI